MYTCLEIADIPIDSGKIGVSVMTVGITVAVVNIAVVAITEEGVDTTLVVSGTISVFVMITGVVGIMIVVSCTAYWMTFNLTEYSIDLIEYSVRLKVIQ